jgi:hypothetical protein
VKKTIQEYVEELLSNTVGLTGEENIIEFACDVSEAILEDNHPDMDHYVVEDCGMSRFTEQSQDLFDGYYGLVRKQLDP